MSEGSSSAPRLSAFVIVSALFLCLVHGLLYHFSDGSVVDRVLRDTDSYSWMNRVLHLAGDGGWLDRIQPRINPPEGHAQHWTRPLDALLWAGGALLGLFVGFRDGLFYWGFVLPPLLHVGAVVALVYAARPLVRAELLDRSRVPLLWLVLLSQVGVYQPFLAGRTDHHAPLALLFMVQLALWIRTLQAPRPGTAALLGAVHALALWINPEAMIYIVIVMGSLLVHWLLTGDSRVARGNAAYGLAMAAGTWAALAIEWGPGLFGTRAMDVIGLPHGVLMILVAGFWGGLCRLGEGKRASARVAWAGAGAIAVFGIVLPLFPEFLADPLGQMDPLYRETRLARISELQTLWSFAGSPLSGIGNTVLYIGAALGGTGFLIARLRRVHRAERIVLWGTLLVLVLVYLVLTLRQARWSDYLGLVSVIPFTLLVAAVLSRWDPNATDLRTRVTRAPATFVIAFAPILLGLLLMALGGEGAGPSERVERVQAAWDTAAEELPETVIRLPSGSIEPDEELESRNCSLVRIGDVLNDPEVIEPGSLVMAHADYGPELLYRTSHSVLSIPNHRPQPGYRLTREILDHSDPDAAEELLGQSGVDVVVLCLRDVTSAFFGGVEDEDLYVHELVRGRVPEGFELIAAGPDARIYRRAR